MKWFWLFHQFAMMIIINGDACLGSVENRREVMLDRDCEGTVASLQSSGENDVSLGKHNGSPYNSGSHRRLKQDHRQSGNEEDKIIFRRKAGKLGRKLALNQSLRKKKHHRRYNQQRNNRIVSGRGHLGWAEEGQEINRPTRTGALDNTSKSIEIMAMPPNPSQSNTSNKDRLKRNYNFDVTYNINNPLCRQQPVPYHRQEFYFENCKIPHRICVNRSFCPYGTNVWSVNVNNFENMNMHSDNSEDLHVDTQYSNLKLPGSSKHNHNHNHNRNRNQRCRSTTPQYSLNFCYNTNRNATCIEIRTQEKKNDGHKPSGEKTELKGNCSLRSVDVTTGTDVAVRSTTEQVNPAKSTTKPLESKTRLNIIKINRAAHYDKKFGAATLLSCLGVHSESDNNFEQLNQIAL